MSEHEHHEEPVSIHQHDDLSYCITFGDSHGVTLGSLVMALEYQMRQGEYHQADLRKAAELGITVAQLEDAMQYADEVRDERW